jgi:molecular chaperone GrpE
VSDKPRGQSEAADSREGLSAELEEALREASEAIDTGRGAGSGGAKKTADQATLEALSDELGNLKAEYEARMAELEELRDRSLRQQAEFENFRRRSLKEREEAHHFGHQNLVKDLLPTVDNLERALEHAEGSEGANLEGLLQGVNLVLREFEAALRKHSVQLVEAEGQTFDPAVHEAVGQVPDASLPPNTVAHVLQKGYKLHDRMLRPARVMVTRAPDGDDRQGTGDDAHAGGGEKPE